MARHRRAQWSESWVVAYVVLLLLIALILGALGLRFVALAGSSGSVEQPSPTIRVTNMPLLHPDEGSELTFTPVPEP